MTGGKGVTCPSCGYDLRGVVSSWSESCPLEGVCSECGYAFRWGALLDPPFRIAITLYDRPGRLSIFNLLHSLLLCYRPWRLWQEAREVDVFCLRRTLVVASVGCIASHLMAIVAVQVVLLTLAAVSLSPLDYEPWMRALSFGWPYTDWSGEYYDESFGVAWLGFVVGWSIAAPIVGALMPSTIAAGSFDLRRWLRIWLHSLPTLPLIACLIGLAGMIEHFALRSRDYETLVLALRIGLAGVWMAAWWSLAYGKYLHLRSAVPRGISTVLLAGAIGMMAVGFLYSIAVLLFRGRW